ncbi:hypothetical protein CYMTET_2718 [Cymbomonas tetramitiformis]|uniref:Uncharacterized protein n=1 Tax=Cymbomonas tetramitiformis TaxID=36881 RepID=A0AAE0H4S1_9CHLO|nr:hypothetical protein CYMTET_44607 [Cymbomonas tetramitiformis]KAK3289859.1 hypothetical protein CYMTET_2718 [Cymbomonas tetramitiformis]
MSVCDSYYRRRKVPLYEVRLRLSMRRDAHDQTEAADADECPTVHVVCTASAYVRASGNLHDICLKKVHKYYKESCIESVRVEMILVDDTKENMVLMLSENMCNIGREFSELHSLFTISSENLPAVLCTGLCATYIMGKNETVDDNNKRIVVIMVTEGAQRIRSLIDEMLTISVNEKAFCEVCELKEYEFKVSGDDLEILQ